MSVRTAAAAVITAAALTASGCAQFNASMSQQEAVVTFAPGTPQATMLKVRAACANVAGARAETIPRHANATNGVYDVRFRVDQASDADIARLSKCLSQFRAVRGVSLEQQDGS